MDTMDNKEVHMDVDQIRLLIAERKGEIKREFKAEVVGIFRIIRTRRRKRRK